ncbi:g9870 [Coccomyxa elongata]
MASIASTLLGILTEALAQLSYSLISVGVNLSAIAISVILFPIFLTAGVAIEVARWNRRPNILAGPGNPDIDFPNYQPLGAKCQQGGRTGWFRGIYWILQSESFLEVAMILQILPVLLVPLQIIFNNVLEEALSCFYGKYNMLTGETEPSVFSTGILRSFPTLLGRIGRTCYLLHQWLAYLLFGNNPKDYLNKNHAFINYIQGFDFSIDKATLGDFPAPLGTSKLNALVLAKCSHIAYDRLYIIRDYVNRNWSGAQYMAGWEFDYVSLRPPKGKEVVQQSDISAFLLRVGPAGKGRALILAFRGTEPFKNVNWAVDFQTAPPPAGETWPYGVYHMGFRAALGLGPNLASDATCYTKYLTCPDTGDYSRMKGPTSPFNVIKEQIDKLLGAALANIFTAALVVPKSENQHYEPKFGALCTLGQPRVGNAAYSNTLENILSPNRMHRRYMRIVNTDDIVCRVPPPQVTPPPWYLDAPFWQHPGHLVFLPAVPARFTAAQVNEVQVNGAQPAHAMHPRPFRVAPRNAHNAQPGARVRNPSAVQLLETPVIYRGSSLWHAIKKAIWATQDVCTGGAGANPPSTLTFSPAPSTLRVLTLWLLVITVLPLGLALLPTPLFPLGLALIVVGVLEGGLPQGVSDHALDGYIRAIVASSDSDWMM